MQLGLDPIALPGGGLAWAYPAWPNTRVMRIARVPALQLSPTSQAEAWARADIPAKPTSRYTESVPNPSAPYKVLVLGDLWTEGRFTDYDTAQDYARRGPTGC